MNNSNIALNEPMFPPESDLIKLSVDVLSGILKLQEASSIIEQSSIFPDHVRRLIT